MARHPGSDVQRAAEKSDALFHALSQEADGGTIHEKKILQFPRPDRDEDSRAGKVDNSRTPPASSRPLNYEYDWTICCALYLQHNSSL